jgi:YidC/Oxa1 family membrane protein insertase
MPLMYGVWGFAFPAGLIVYWTTANGIQIAQQTLMLRAGHIGPEALERRMAEQRAKMAANDGKPQRKGIMAWMNEKAEQAQQQQPRAQKPQPGPKSKGDGAKRPPRPSNANPKQQPPRKPTKGAAPGNQLKPKKKQP